MSRASLFTQQVSSYLQSITQRQPLQQTAFDVVVPYNNQSAQPAVIVDTVSQLLQRAEEYEVVSSAVIVNAVLYVHRFLRMTQTQLTSENVVPIMTTAMCIANKFTEDIPYDNRTFWQLSGIPVQVLAKLELHFLAALRFRLTVDMESFQQLNEAFHAPPRAKNLLDKFQVVCVSPALSSVSSCEDCSKSPARSPARSSTPSRHRSTTSR